MADDSNDVSSLFEGAAEFEGEPPTPPDHDENYYNAEVLIGWLNSVAKGHDRYYCLSHVFSSASVHSRRAGRKDDRDYLSPAQHERVLHALRQARNANPSMFWEDTPVARQITRQGFETLEQVLTLWSSDFLERMAFSDEERRDVYDYARIFQNLMHNISLAEEIEERMRARAVKDVAKIRTLALGAAATVEAAS